VAVPLEDPSLLTLTGHLAVWGGFNDNGKAVNGTFTFNIGGTGSDGSRFHQNVVEHFNTTPTGATAAAEAVARQLGVPSRWFVFLAPLCSANAMRSCAPLSERPVTGEVGYRSHAELIDDATARWIHIEHGLEAMGAIRSIWGVS
jgi:hypothetical protein